MRLDFDIGIGANTNKQTNKNKQLKTKKMKTIKIMTTLEFTRTKTDHKTYEYKVGDWRIFKEGGYAFDVNEGCELFDPAKGAWGVEFKGVHYGWFDTLKDAKQYIKNWISINPKDI